MLDTILIATHNQGKLREFQNLLQPMRCLSLNEYQIKSVEESGASFIENAILKARHACAHSQLPALADDSGLVVPSLNGAPGIYSARFAGPDAKDEDNIERLLDQMRHLGPTQRHAYFYCALVFMNHEHDPTPLIASAKLEGSISLSAKGTHGFGYDPIFYLPAKQCTLAELTAEVKNSLSHRALALKSLTINLAEKLNEQASKSI